MQNDEISPRMVGKCFAPVVPVQTASVLRDMDMLGNYHLLLAHDVLEHRAEYRDIYGDITRNGGIVIMDNSLIELGKPMEVSDMLEALDVVPSTYAVLPDVLGDVQETLRLSIEAIHEYAARAPQQRLMGVMQGDSHTKCFDCAANLALMGVNAISVPRHLANILGSRVMLVDYLLKKHSAWPVHLLGFSDSPLDDFTAARYPNVMGIDSAAPIRQAFRGIRFSLDLFIEPGPRGDYWELNPNDLPEELLTLLEENLSTIRSILYHNVLQVQD